MKLYMYLLMKFTNTDYAKIITGKYRFNQLLNNHCQTVFHRHVNGCRDEYIEAAFFEKQTSSLISIVKDKQRFQSLYKKIIRKPNLKGYRAVYTISDKFLSLLDDLKFGYTFMVSASAHERTRDDCIQTVHLSDGIKIHTITKSDFFEYDVPYQHIMKNSEFKRSTITRNNVK